MRIVAFTQKGFEEYNEWFATNLAIIDRIKILIRDIDRDSFKGLGKPEPLKGNWSGYWSRRITDEHRLVYKVTSEQILIAKCSGHY
ncbi:MAG: Txe/YoeB family addiction module toxin [Chitinophagaceae bacterium]